MGLKRKASFTASPSGTPSLPGTMITLDETTRHLPSRTRKRFRDDRPDEQTVYAQTLRWLFSAAQKPTPALPEEEPTSPPPSKPEPIDSRQQTLDKFFRRVEGSSSSAHMSTGPRQTETPSSTHWKNTVKSHVNEGDIVMSSDESGSGSPNSTSIDVEMEM